MFFCLLANYANEPRYQEKMETELDITVVIGFQVRVGSMISLHYPKRFFSYCLASPMNVRRYVPASLILVCFVILDISWWQRGRKRRCNVRFGKSSGRIWILMR